jgi:hypothetical protein
MPNFIFPSNRVFQIVLVIKPSLTNILAQFSAIQPWFF